MPGGIFEKTIWWGWKGLNLRPTGYEPAALTTELHPRGTMPSIANLFDLENQIQIRV